jgi:hypothetical protein
MLVANLAIGLGLAVGAIWVVEVYDGDYQNLDWWMPLFLVMQ